MSICSSSKEINERKERCKKQNEYPEVPAARQSEGCYPEVRAQQGKKRCSQTSHKSTAKNSLETERYPEVDLEDKGDFLTAISSGEVGKEVCL